MSDPANEPAFPDRQPADNVASAVLEAAHRLQSRVLEPMKQSFVGKDEVIDVLGIALACGENLFLLGPPGTAKTALVHELSQRIQAKHFDYLLTRFTEPNELFGPFDIRQLREGQLVTNTEGMLPEADLIFLDELLNANSAILNSLLMVLNERVFRRGREMRRIPALMVVGASNHLPEEESLQALFDRFPIRVRCGPVADESLQAVLVSGWQRGEGIGPALRIGAEEIRAIQAGVAQVDLTGVRPALAALVLQLRQAGVAISDRRAVRLQRFVAASALLSGRPSARLRDLWVAAHVWDREEQIETAAALVRAAMETEAAAPGDHPRSVSPDEPDAEALGAALQALAAKAAVGKTAGLGDELRVLSTRVEWVVNPASRRALQEQCRDLWQQIS